MVTYKEGELTRELAQANEQRCNAYVHAVCVKCKHAFLVRERGHSIPQRQCINMQAPLQDMLRNFLERAR